MIADIVDVVIRNDRVADLVDDDDDDDDTAGVDCVLGIDDKIVSSTSSVPLTMST